MSDRIDLRLREVWRAANLAPTETTTDNEFCRRVYLDLTGCIPRISETEKFLQSTRPDRRARLIDELLRRPAHAQHQADAWLRALLPENANLRDFIMHGALRQWLTEGFDAHRPFDEMIREMLVTRDDYRAIYFYLAGPMTPAALTGRTAEALLGLDLKCAECHDHPFGPWKREDFWGLAAFFAHVRLQQKTNVGVVLATSIQDDKLGQLRFPGTENVVVPRYLDGDVANSLSGQTRRQQLATWLTSRDNPYFARATVNRVWAMLFGQQLVEYPQTVGHRKDNALTTLLDELAAHFVNSGFNIGELIGTVAKSKAYQATSRAIRNADTPVELFHRRAARSLSAEQFHESLAQVIQQKYNLGPRDGPGLAYDLERMAFVTRMQSDPGQANAYSGEVHQALHLMNGKRIAKVTDWKQSPLLGSLLDAELEDGERVDLLFIAALARQPSTAVRRRLVQQLKATPSGEAKGAALSDILWALLNTAEFGLNH